MVVREMPFAGKDCRFISMFILYVSSHIMTVKVPRLLPNLYVTLLQLNFLSTTLRHPFSVWSNSTTALNICGFVHHA